jgi:hypothetical protein
MVVQPMPGVSFRPVDNDIICKIIRNLHIVEEYCLDFVIHFLHISPSASVYSKVPKQSRVCLSICEYKPSCKTLFVEKNYCNILSFYSVFLKWGHIDSMVLLTVNMTPWYC